MANDHGVVVHGSWRPSRLLWGLGIGLSVLAGLFAWKQSVDSLPERLREQSKQAAARGRWQEADAVLARLIALDPYDGEAWLARARAAHELGDLARSAKILDDMPADCAQKLTALRALAELQLGPQNTPRAAERTLRLILDSDPTSAFAHQRLLSFYALTLQRQALVREAHLAMQRDCEPVEAYLYLFFADELDFTNGIEVNRRWLAGDPKSELFRVAESFNLARALAGGAPRDDLDLVQKFRQMAENLDRVMAELLQEYPANLELLAWHIERTIEQGNTERVIELLTRLPGVADDDNRFWRFSGWAKARLGHPYEADADYNHALRLNPLDWSTRNLLASLLREQQRFDEVERLQGMVTRARELARAVKVLPDVRSVSDNLLGQLADYAGDCGDELFAASLRRHLSRRAAERGRHG